VVTLKENPPACSRLPSGRGRQANIATDLTHSIKNHFLRVAVKKLTATIQIFYLGLGCQGVLARLRSGRPACGRAGPPACRQTRPVGRQGGEWRGWNKKLLGILSKNQ